VEGPARSVEGPVLCLASEPAVLATLRSSLISEITCSRCPKPARTAQVSVVADSTHKGVSAHLLERIVDPLQGFRYHDRVQARGPGANLVQAHRLDHNLGRATIGVRHDVVRAPRQESRGHWEDVGCDAGCRLQGGAPAQACESLVGISGQDNDPLPHGDGRGEQPLGTSMCRAIARRIASGQRLS